MKEISINGRTIGKNFPPYIIAELSANHNGNLEKALKTISLAKDCGADAIKIQTYTPDTMTIDCDREEFMIKGGLWDGYKLYDLYNDAQTPFEWHKEIFEYASKIGLTCFSTPFDESAVDLLESLETPAYKIASFELTDLPLLKYVASKGKPIILSTGMANLDEITDAVKTTLENGCEDLVLLHCISSYPAPIEESNLLTIEDLKKKFNLQIGLSDHTLDNTASVVAVALGAVVIEKHFIADKNDKGPDSEFSIDCSELKKLSKETKSAWKSLGKAGYDRKKSEESSLKFRRSLYFVKDIKAGEIITIKNMRRIRPGYGLPAKYEEKILGKRVKKDVSIGTPVEWSLIYD